MSTENETRLTLSFWPFLFSQVLQNEASRPTTIAPKFILIHLDRISKTDLACKEEIFTFPYPLTAGVVGAPQMTSSPTFSILLCSPLAAGTWPVHSLMLSSFFFFYLPYILPPSSVPCKMVLARLDKRETCPFHFSLRPFTIVRWSSCGPIACWILARTSSLITH